MNKHRFSVPVVLGLQAVVLLAFTAAFFLQPRNERDRIEAAVTGRPVIEPVPITVAEPVRVSPLYNDADVVSDEELAAVLNRIRPVFSASSLKPNYVEHALRAWGVDAEFQDPRAMSGIEMRDFLTDHGRFLASWGEQIEPLLNDDFAGVRIRWGSEEGASVHHDHLLACLTEAGVELEHPVFTPTRNDLTINDILQQALLDFRLDERETEWSSMAFAFWLAPSGIKGWTVRDGRHVNFDMIARRLLRGHQRYGVCSGTHRVYSMMALIRLDDDYQILSAPMRAEVYAHLEFVRDMLIESQFDDGSWPPNWSEGKKARETPTDDPIYRTVIATGHHLEWLAIAPLDLHPPRERILKAADWIVANATSKTIPEIQTHYTFYSHVGNALALWRGTRPAVFWKQWQAEHPFDPNTAEPLDGGNSSTDTDAAAH